MDYSIPPPACRPMTKECITVLGDQTEPDSESQDSDVEMYDTGGLEESEEDEEDEEEDEEDEEGEDELPDSQCRPSIESDDYTDNAFHTGGQHQRPKHAWMMKMAQPIPDEWRVEPVPQPEQELEDSFDSYDEDDLADLDEDDAQSISSNWDYYGDLPLTMAEYDRAAAKLEGSEKWNPDQKKLHKLIYMRGLHPILPSWWRVSLRMWGVTQPQLDDLFTPKNSKKKVAIHAHGNEVAAAKALESLFILSQTVTDYEEIGETEKIAPAIVKVLRGYVDWAMRDSGIDKKQTLLNTFVVSYVESYGADDDSDSAGSDSALSEMSEQEDEDGNRVVVKRARDPAITAKRRQDRFQLEVSRDLQRRLYELGKRWRELLWNEESQAYDHTPPTVFAFAIVQHVVLLASIDSASATSPVVVLETVSLNDRRQWLWNALTLALAVNLARDRLMEMWDTGKVVKLEAEEGDDPDL